MPLMLPRQTDIITLLTLSLDFHVCLRRHFSPMPMSIIRHLPRHAAASAALPCFEAVAYAFAAAFRLPVTCHFSISLLLIFLRRFRRFFFFFRRHADIYFLMP